MKFSKAVFFLCGAALLGVAAKNNYFTAPSTPAERAAKAEAFVVAHNVGIDNFCRHKASAAAGDPYNNPMFHNAALYHGINNSCHTEHPYL